MAYRTFSVVLFCLCGLIDRTPLTSAEDNLVYTSIVSYNNVTPQTFDVCVRRLQRTSAVSISRMIDLTTPVERCMYDMPCSSNDLSIYDDAHTHVVIGSLLEKWSKVESIVVVGREDWRTYRG